LAEARGRRLVTQYAVTEAEAAIITGEKALADLFEQTVAAGAPAKATANWVTGRLLHIVSERGLDLGELPLKPPALAELVNLVESGAITGTAARPVFDRIIVSGESPKAVVQELGLAQISDTNQLAAVVDEVLAENPEAVGNFRKGKEAALKFLVGQIMRKSKGRANPQIVTELLRAKLG
jgi:aspartyl-tRNA(Asn)/glutamyl-tRNA(Gln) amidotransferase subunit B